MISAGDDQTAQIWDAASGKRLLTFTNPDTSARIFGIMTVSWSPDGRRIVSAGDKTLVWDAQTSKTLFSYGPLWQLFSSLTFTVAWSPDGTRIASDVGNAVRVWQPQ
jgi:WD40 repeat protein